MALKILPLEYGKDPTFAERFAREARTLARLNHPNIVAIYDFGDAAGWYYFLMEFVDGLNLRQLEQSRKLTAEQALAIVPKICDALQYAHEEGVVHRDIKPGNILIDTKGRVKIADFGLAKLLGKVAPDLTLTGSGHRMGTPHYMAPEQIDRPQAVDHRADIYSLGVVFYEMLTGELPVGRFAAPSQKVQVDVRLDDVVLRTLENNPERRYQQAGEVKTDVESITRNPPLRLAPVPVPTPSPVLGADVLDAARRRVRAPSLALMIYAIVNLITILLPFHPVAARMPALVGLGWTEGIRGFPFHLLPMATFLQLLLPVIAQVCLLIGAARLRDLVSYGWALAAALMAMIPFGPLWIVGLGFGIWTLVVIHQPTVRAALDRGVRLTGVGSAPTSPRFAYESDIPVISRKAIVGVCLIAVPLALVLLWFMPVTRISGLVLPGHATEVLRISPFLFGPVMTPWFLGLPIVTTILGVVAIKDIRYSNGRIVGLRLALFDALFFPLLALNVVVFALSISAARIWAMHLIFAEHSHVLWLAFLSLGVLICVVLDFRIVRACWVALRRPLPSASGRTDSMRTPGQPCSG